MPRFTYLSVSKMSQFERHQLVQTIWSYNTTDFKVMPERQEIWWDSPKDGDTWDSTLAVLFYPANVSSVGHHGATLPLTC